MYEQHFGLSGHPFATTPDPDFYFDSHGHRRAFAYLRYAVLQGESFVVLTGDIHSNWADFSGAVDEPEA